MFLLLCACQAQVTATVTAPEGGPQVGEQAQRAPTPADPTEAARQETLGVAAGRNNEPMRFTFPTPAPVPASRWRPPLYEVPWALGPHDHFYLTRPIAADEVNWPEWDYRYGGVIEGKELGHSGIDIAANRGIPVIAAGPGVVGWAGYGLLNRDDDLNDPYGLAVMIEHDFGYDGHRVSSVYGHLDRIDVAVGQRVVAGQQVGIVGITGNSTGPHLHFETRLQFGNYAATRNPELWLAPPQGWGVLVARLMRENSTPYYQMPVFVQSKANAQVWEVHTYGPTNIHYDDYYRESMVLSDLPAGEYEVSFTLKKEDEKGAEKEEVKIFNVTIRPGGITYFVFKEDKGFSTALPAPTPGWTVTPVK